MRARARVRSSDASFRADRCLGSREGRGRGGRSYPLCLFVARPCVGREAKRRRLACRVRTPTTPPTWRSRRSSGSWRPQGVDDMPARIPSEASRPLVSDEAIAKLILGLLRRTHLSVAAELAEVVAEEAAAIGARDVVLYVVDLEQETLVPLPSPAATTVGAQPQSVGGTVAGRTFATTTVLTAPSENGGRPRGLGPLLHRPERAGVVAVSFHGAAARGLSRGAGGTGTPRR